MVAVESTGFGELLRRLRLTAGLTQEALAERASVSTKAISDLERDPGRLPRLDTVSLLADALGLDSAGRARLLTAARPDGAPLSAALPPAGAPAGLPQPLTPLIGRAGVTDAVADLLRRGESRLVTLTGPGGVGKTRLAIAAAACAADDFADGVAFVDLAPLRDPDLVLPTIAQGLGIDERERAPLRERLVVSLRSTHMLLLLDNLEHVVAAREGILGLLQDCSRLVVLATSRVALRLRGERVYHVAPLEVPADTDPSEVLSGAPAVALFTERARAAGAELTLTAATASAVAQICRRLDGLPLAIELAAAWARILPPPALLARLDERLPLLVGGPHDMPARQRTMRDAIAWSYDLLDASEQRLFRWLSVFTGGCTIEAAEAVCAEAGGALLTDLAALVDKSLLRVEEAAHPDTVEPRLVMLETLREFGLERLEESCETGLLRRRHAAHYLALAEAAEPELGGPNGPFWRARLEREDDNLRAALGWMLGCGECELALRLAGALWRFWSERGHLSEGRRWLREALAATTEAAAAASAARGKALAGAAMLAIEQAAFDEAEELCARAVALARDHAAWRDLVVALNIQGLLAREHGRYADALRYHEEARTLAEELADQAGVAAALTGLGYAALLTGDAARANALSEQSLAVFRQLGDTRGLAEALVGLAWRATHAGAHARAEVLGTEALDLFRVLGDTGRMADALWVLGVAAQFQGEYERAVALHQECLALRRARGDEHGTVQPLSSLGRIALQFGDHARARSLLEETLITLQRYDDRWSRAMSLALLGHVELAAGNDEQAQALLGESAALHQSISNPLYLSWCLEGLAGLAAARGQWVAAARVIGAGDALRARLGTPIPPAYPTGHAATLAAVRAALGDDAFGAASQAGQALPPERAIAEGIALTPDHGCP